MRRLMMTAAALALLTTAADAASKLPETFLGEWCAIHGDVEPAPGHQSYLPSEGDKCERSDRLTIKRNELTAIESSCRFRSIKRTNDLRPNHTQATKADLTPVMEVLADCEGEGVKSVVKMRLIYQKGALSIEHRVLSEKNSY